MSRAAGPFSPRMALGLVLFGAACFVAMLWMIGSGMADSKPSAVGGHVQGKGLNGYAALSQYLQKRGYKVANVQSQGAVKRTGVLILTPSQTADPKVLTKLVESRRQVGPTIVILPKWIATQLPRLLPNGKPAKEGFVQLRQVMLPNWTGFYDDVSIKGGALKTGSRPGAWEAAGLSGVMPVPDKVISGDGEYVIPLVMGSGTQQVLAGYISDGGYYPALRAASVGYDEVEPDEDPIDQYPVLFVFDADLFNNYGMARPENAVLAERLINAALDGKDRVVLFDLTMLGYGRSRSLLTLAFTPPFLAATLCLLLAGAVVLWRAYRRFGPPVQRGQTIAFGKRALVSNSAGLIYRARRMHLVGAPYADAARDRLARALALPARLGHDKTEAAIDRALAARAPGATPFSVVAAQLRGTYKPIEMLRAARQLHALERTLTR
ncbi:MAG: DUF4350 domain-containing protein [Sphingomonadales bacterium]|nr:DUF4350 domain-containing protein [Sphingomonadales bacterium]